MRKILSIFLALVCLVIDAKANTVFIDPVNGLDTNPGTLASPLKTIPGTFKADGSGYLQTAWGSFTSSSKVPDNTAFIIKSGTTLSSNICGYVQLAANGGDFYLLGCTNLYFGVTNNWGSGPTTIDASNMAVSIAAFLIQIDGVTVNGLTIKNSPHEGLQVKEKQGTGAAQTNITLLNLTMINNVTFSTDDASGSGSSEITVRYCNGLTVSNCTVNGNNNWSEGILLGDNHKHVINAIIQSCTVSNLQGDIPNNDSGIGFKALNSVATWSNCVSAWNLKGWDTGEEAGDGSNINYKVISCTASNNYWGINFNAVGTIPYVGLPINFYAINNLVVSNAYNGIHVYAGPYNLFVINNVLDNNGPQGSTYNGINLSITPDNTFDTNVITAYVYNNIFKRAFDYQLETSYATTTNNQSWFCDYNSYQQQGSEGFAHWSASFGPTEAFFSYGANGPGHASGNWYSWYENSSVNAARGSGHFNSDAHSTGTGAANTNLPALTASYNLNTTFPGTNISKASWFTSEMGIDRAGLTRVNWDVGAFEATTNLTLSITPSPCQLNQLAHLVISITTNGVIDTSRNDSFNIYTNNVLLNGSLGLGSGSFNSTALPSFFHLGVTNNYYITLSSGILTNLGVLFIVTNDSTSTSTLVSSANPIASATPVTFTCTIKTNSAVPSSPSPTGTVNIFSDGVSIGSGSPSSGIFSVTTSALAVGVHVITATYTGDATYNTNYFAGFNQSITAGGLAATTTTITFSPNPAISPALVTGTFDILTNGVLAANASGSITVTINSVFAGTVNVVNGIATVASTIFPTVSDIMQGFYTGDSNYAGSTSTNFLLINFNGTVYAQVAFAPNLTTYYIGTNATGLFATQGLRGTATNALDGSTQFNFDSNMGAIPAGATINLVTTNGVYPTIGSSGYAMKYGWTINGVGMFKTTIQFPLKLVTNGTVADNILLAAFGNSSHITIKNLTLDCNFQAQTNFSSRLRPLRLVGDSNTVLNVFCKNAGVYSTSYMEGFGPTVFGAPTVATADGNVFNNVIVTNYSGNFNGVNFNNMVALNMNGVQDSTITNCQVWQTSSNITYAINVSGSNILVISNIVNGCTVFSYADSLAGAMNLTYQWNTISNVVSMLEYSSGNYLNLNFLNNIGNILRRLPTDNGTAFIMTPPYGVFAPLTINNWLVSSNNINGASTNGMFNVYLGTNITVQANTMFTSSPTNLEMNFINCGPVTVSGNSNQINQPWP